MSFNLTNSLEFIVSLNHTYDSQPIFDLKKSDLVTTTTGINFKF
jgi:hypothetical protein